MKREDIKTLKLSKTLAGWCLPMLSRAIAADEAESDALALYNSIKTLAEKQAR